MPRRVQLDRHAWKSEQGRGEDESKERCTSNAGLWATQPVMLTAATGAIKVDTMRRQDDWIEERGIEAAPKTYRAQGGGWEHLTCSRWP